MNDQGVAMMMYSLWAETGRIDKSFFSENFEYIGASPVVAADAWMHVSGEEMPPDDLVLIDRVESCEKAVLLFEYKDFVTLLRFRVSWFFCLKGEKISRIVEVRQSVDPGCFNGET